MNNMKKHWHKIALFFILALTGFLSFYAIGKEGYANTYYAAAVKSMLTSWHNFFFVSFDAGGYVSVDKPALGLWLQALSAKVFGFYGWSLILPEALSAVISVAVVYHLVRRTFGKIAGLISALVLALSPILIAVSRTNNLDASLVMVLLFAAWALIVAAERSSFKLLLLSMALVGLGFNIKMLEAFMVLPAFYIVYLITSSLKAGKKILHLTGATAVLLAVSLSWAVIVDTTPASQRPYVGSSQTNSVIELALGYNGIQRITGREDGSRMDGSDKAEAVSPATASDDDRQNSAGQTDGQLREDGSNQWDGNAPGQDDASGMQTPPGDANIQQGENFPSGGDNPQGMDGGRGGADGQNGMMGGGGPGGTGEGGAKGLFRLFNEQMAGQISWLIPMAFFGLFAGFVRARRGAVTGNAPARRSLLLWGASIVPMMAYFSIAGFFHRYYLSMLAPGIAALTGIGIVEMWKLYMDKGWKCFILPAALLSTAAVQGLILSRYPQWSGILLPVVCGVSAIAALGLIALKICNKEHWRKTVKGMTAAALAALLIAPALWSYTPILYGSQSVLPVAGPELNRESGGRGGFAGADNAGTAAAAENAAGDLRQGGGMTAPSQESTTSSKLISFLLDNNQGEKFLVAVSNANSASPIILQTGKAVMAVGGFGGSDPILTADKLEEMVNNGEIRYFLVQGMGGMGSRSDVASWVQENGTAVASGEWSDAAGTSGSAGFAGGLGQMGGRMENGGTLYDLTPEKGTNVAENNTGTLGGI